jgi:hypothetical protein
MQNCSRRGRYIATPLVRLPHIPVANPPSYHAQLQFRHHPFIRFFFLSFFVLAFFNPHVFFIYLSFLSYVFIKIRLIAVNAKSKRNLLKIPVKGFAAGVYQSLQIEDFQFLAYIQSCWYF